MTSDAPEYFIESRTAAEVDDRCGMQFWWNFIEADGGIVPVDTAEALTVGKEAHEDAEVLARIDLRKEAIAEYVAEILKADSEDLKLAARENLYRRAGWFAADALFLEPKVRAEYETVSVEAEIILDRDPLWVPITPDRILRHRGDDPYLVYRERKTTKWAGPKWMASWPFAIQLHAGIAAAEEELGERVAFGQIVGMLKGDRRGDRLTSPLVWARRSAKTGAWESDYDKSRTAEWVPAPVWEYEGGVVRWCEDVLGAEGCLSQFPHSHPVFLNKRILDDWVTRRLARRRQIEEIRDEAQVDWETRVINFEPRTSKCRPAYGDPCPYIRCCWLAEINQNPLSSDQFVRRTPHHDFEIIGVEE